MNLVRHLTSAKDIVVGFIFRLIPLVLLASLTMLSFWYLQKNTQPEAPSVKKPLSHRPDYIFSDVKLTVLNLDGSTKYRLLGKEFKHYEDDASIDIFKPQLRLFNAKVVPTTILSNQAIVSGDLDVLELFKNVNVSRPNQLSSSGLIINPFFQLDSEYLKVFVNEDRLTTHLPVKIQRGDSIVNAAKGADYDNISQEILMYGDVRGQIAPMDNSQRTIP